MNAKLSSHMVFAVECVYRPVFEICLRSAATEVKEMVGFVVGWVGHNLHQFW